jgi:hypothetical protein
MLACLFDLEAKPGKEAEVGSFLRSGLPLVKEEPATIAWSGIVWIRQKKRFEFTHRGDAENAEVAQRISNSDTTGNWRT